MKRFALACAFGMLAVRSANPADLRRLVCYGTPPSEEDLYQYLNQSCATTCHHAYVPLSDVAMRRSNKPGRDAMASRLRLNTILCRRVTDVDGKPTC